MTEDEARQRWCPFARVSLVPDCDGEPILPAHNRQVSEKEQLEGRAHCIASECMAWRWQDEPRQVGTDIKCEHCGGAGVIGGEECPHCVTGYQVEGVPVGYCGLAGKP